MLVDGMDPGDLEFYSGNTAMTCEQARSPVRVQMVIGLSQNKIKTKKIPPNTRSMKTTFHEQPMKISDFFLVTSVSAGEHPLVKRSGALQGDEIFIYLNDIRSLLLRNNS